MWVLNLCNGILIKLDGAPLPWVSQPDNIKDFYDVGTTFTNNIAFDGGGDNITYRVSVGNMDQEGMVPFTDFRRFNVGAVLLKLFLTNSQQM